MERSSRCCLRFAIANVSSEVVDKIPERLIQLNELYGMKSSK